MVTLELITPRNAMVFKGVRLQALQDTPSAFGSTYAKESLLTDAEWVRRAARWTDGRSIAYLALDSGTPCGIAGSFLDQNDASRARLVSMWVAPTHRRRGIGRRLIDAILSWVRSQNVRCLQLMVTSNNAPAIAFYERLEFSLTGRTEPYPNNPDLIEYEMSRSIVQ